MAQILPLYLVVSAILWGLSVVFLKKKLKMTALQLVPIALVIAAPVTLMLIIILFWLAIHSIFQNGIG